MVFPSTMGRTELPIVLVRIDVFLKIKFKVLFSSLSHFKRSFQKRKSVVLFIIATLLGRSSRRETKERYDLLYVAVYHCDDSMPMM